MSKKAERAALTQEKVRDLFDYDEETGWLTWRARRELSNYQADRIGKRAGTVNKQGYRYVGIGTVIYRDSHLVWLWMTGDMPFRVYPKNFDKADTRWSNLTASVMARPTRPPDKTRLRGRWGKPGITALKGGRFHAQIIHKGETRQLGIFDSLSEAIDARWAAEREILRTSHRLRGMDIYHTLNGMTKNVSQWVDYFGISRRLFERRVAAGVPFEEMGLSPSHKKSGRPRKVSTSVEQLEHPNEQIEQGDEVALGGMDAGDEPAA